MKAIRLLKALFWGIWATFSNDPEQFMQCDPCEMDEKIRKASFLEMVEVPEKCLICKRFKEKR